MKKLFALLLFGILISTLNASARSRFFDLDYGNYKCTVNGETCEYYIYESGSGGHGKGCPLPKKGEHPDIHFDKLADLFTSKNCQFTPSKIEKYECKHSYGHLTVYRENNKVFSVTGHIPDGIKFEDTYNPYLCTRVPMTQRKKQP